MFGKQPQTEGDGIPFPAFGGKGSGKKLCYFMFSFVIFVIFFISR